MKRLYIAAFVAATLTITGCGTEDDRTPTSESTSLSKREEAGEPEGSAADTARETEIPKNDSTIRKAAARYCDCFHESYGNIDPRIKRIIVTAGKSDNPNYVLQNELMKIANQEEQQRVLQEILEIADDNKMQACIQRISQRYRVDENDAATQKQVIKELANDKDCELVAALLKIAQQQEANQSP